MLYLVITEEHSNGRKSLDIAREAIKGGIDFVQMREKKKTPEELISLGKELAVLCKDNNVNFIVNDDPYLAKEVDADGVHLGQEDIMRFPLGEVRNIIGKDGYQFLFVFYGVHR